MLCHAEQTVGNKFPRFQPFSLNQDEAQHDMLLGVLDAGKS